MSHQQKLIFVFQNVFVYAKKSFGLCYGSGHNLFFYVWASHFKSANEAQEQLTVKFCLHQMTPLRYKFNIFSSRLDANPKHGLALSKCSAEQLNK